MKKRLNVTGISDELRGGSVFFGGQPPQEPPPLPSPPPPILGSETPVPTTPSKPEETDERLNERPNVQTTESTNEQMNERSNVQTVERPKVRNAFDVFTDQIYSLCEIALQRSKSQGKRVTLGDLVQEALDTFIKGE